VGSSEKRPVDAKVLAETIKAYLTDVFGVQPSRITTEGRDKPKLPSEQVDGKLELKLLREGDRRVQTIRHSFRRVTIMFKPNNVQALARNMQNENHHTPVFNVVKKEKYVLYIDDDPDDRENFAYALEQCNAKINLTTAVDADDALEKLASQAKPTCIYLDINMPKMNGIQLLKILKSNTDFAHIPVIIFSTAVDTKSRKEVMNLGAAGVFMKPSSLHRLMDHLCVNLSAHF